MFKNRVLRKVFGTKTNVVRGQWRRLRNGEVCHLFSVPNIIRVFKTRKLGWTGHVACMGERRGFW